MRQLLDCAVLLAPAHAPWAQAWMDRHQTSSGRVRLMSLALPGPGSGAAPPDAPPSQHLLGLQQVLRRYDLCILPVAPASLAWSRMALAGAAQQLPIPVVGLVRGLKAAAVQDLLEFGLADYLREEQGSDDVCTRLALAATGRAAAGARGARRTANGLDPAAMAVPAAPGPIETRRSALQEPAPAYALQPLAGDAPDPEADEAPFRVAKGRMVAAFERDYLSRALRRSGGNIALAARAAQKHRRAFWGLMRKHRIDAAPFRDAQAAPAPRED